MRLDVICDGPSFLLVWAVDSNGVSPGKDFFDSLSAQDQARMMALFDRLAQSGRIVHREHFKQLGDLAKGEAKSLFEFKRHQIRFIGGYLRGKKFAVAHGVRKKKDNLDKETIAKALRVFTEFRELVG